MLYNLIVLYKSGRIIGRNYVTLDMAIDLLQTYRTSSEPIEFVTILDSDMNPGPTSSRPGVKSPLHDHEGNPED